MMVSNFTKNELWSTFPKNDPWAPRSHSVKFEKKSDTWLNNYGLISSQSMLIYHLKLKSPYNAWWCQISPKKKNFGLLFQKLSLGKVSDQLDTRLIKQLWPN